MSHSPAPRRRIRLQTRHMRRIPPHAFIGAAPALRQNDRIWATQLMNIEKAAVVHNGGSARLPGGGSNTFSD